MRYRSLNSFVLHEANCLDDELSCSWVNGIFPAVTGASDSEGDRHPILDQINWLISKLMHIVALNQRVFMRY